AHPDRSFHAVGDSAYGGQSVLGNLPCNCDLTSRLDLDARLYDAPPQRKPRQQGRTPKRGRKLPTPKKMLEGRTKSLTLNLYGRHDRVRVADTVGRTFAVPDRPLRIVAVNPTTGQRGPQAFYSTKTDDSALDVLTRYAMRWSIEEANQNSKGHLGFEEPQGWTRRAVERTAPTAMLLHSVIILWFAKHGHLHYQPPHAPWYLRKTHASFADMLTTLRRESVRQQVSAIAPSGKGCRKLMAVLLHTVQQAA
ncbi:MAG: IS701 family transposase, partial [Burkholderiales bacterium]